MGKSQDYTLYSGGAVPEIVLNQLEAEQSMTDVMKSKMQKESVHPGPLPSVVRIVCFFCLIVALAFALNTVICSGLRQIKTSRFGVSNKIVEGKINTDIVVSGSSRALSHYDPRIIQERTGKTVFNIGLNGSQTDMQLARLKTYLQHNKKPSLLIFNLDLFSFQTTHGGVYDPGQYLPYLKEPAIYDALMHINPETWKAKYLPLYGYTVEDLRFTWLLGLISFFGWNPAEDHFLGFKPQYRAWTGDFERFKEMNPNGVHFAIEPDGMSKMEELLRLCREQGIEVLLVYSPEYKEMQALTTNRAEVFAFFNELSERFGLPIWDYSDSPISFRRESFYNSQHLNAEGASTFSTDIATRIASDPVFSKPPASPHLAAK